MTQQKLKYTYILRISIAIRCDEYKKNFFLLWSPLKADVFVSTVVSTKTA